MCVCVCVFMCEDKSESTIYDKTHLAYAFEKAPEDSYLSVPLSGHGQFLGELFY